ncbi:UDP-glucose/GDP-mannose dehydrogenase family protein [Pseudomonadales bacterium]|nr:UDP-glucose/GDP-mannose dehydrogenase family protein [Pseudomonadales bacterium]MDB2542376.1 UDP-glucose/GDP-mannose dehydrogenase family protein [Pseudomonadales bacterium]
MRITIIGTGYVGLVTGACFSEMGNHVTCVDIDEQKLTKLRQGVVPIHEPGLAQLVEKNTAAGTLDFTSRIEDSLNQSQVVFIAVGTPPNEDGSADLSHVLSVARQIGDKLTSPIIVVDKSTVPVGTADKVLEMITERLNQRGETINFDVVSNPEFLKEGAAIADFMSPDRIVIGAAKESSFGVMSELYASFSRNREKIQTMGVRDAEMTKYAANAMLATKISFMNEIALMCEKYDVDVENVRRGIGSDSRIGYSFIYPGAGYGGSCFPKDVRALVSMAEEQGVDAHIFSAVERRNQEQKTVLLNKIAERFGDDLSGKKVAIWGLAFKPETDDVREASALVMIRGLLARNATIAAYDPEAMETTKIDLGELSTRLEYTKDMYDAVVDADALLVMTEWKQFRQPDLSRLATELREKVIFDGRNLYDPAVVAKHGMDYIGIGRRS